MHPPTLAGQPYLPRCINTEIALSVSVQNICIYLVQIISMVFH